MGRFPEECKAKLTSTEFLSLAYTMQKDEWEEPSRLDYQIAALTQVVIRFMAMFAKDKVEIPTIQECLIKFEDEPQKKEPHERKILKIGDPLDEYWQKVNFDAKMKWGPLLSMLADSLVEIPK